MSVPLGSQAWRLHAPPPFVPPQPFPVLSSLSSRGRQLPPPRSKRQMAGPKAGHSPRGRPRSARARGRTPRSSNPAGDSLRARPSLGTSQRRLVCSGL